MEDKKVSSKLKEALEWIYCIIIAVVLALLIKYYIGIPTVVMQVSMKPTLIQGQRLILDRTVRTFNKELKRGDIITFEAPSKTYYYILDADLDLENPIAKYEKEPKGLFNKFVYYVLETTKSSYIKRVIALPGEHVEIKEGNVYINGEKLEEPYLKDDVKTYGGMKECFVDLVVPEGCVYALGDNRSESTDCRAFGCIPRKKVESRVLFRFWPLNLFGKVK